MIRVKTFNSTGVATDGRIYAGDLNAIQDAAAALADFTQTIDLASIRVGEAGLSLVRYAAGEARLTGALRTDGIVRALGGLYAGAFTEVQRNALVNPIYGLVILNTTSNRYEWNSGTPGAPVWVGLGGFDAATASGVSGYQLAGDLHFTTETRGVVLEDRGSGTWAAKRHRLYMMNGDLYTEEVV